ncbi:MAG: sugar ABC transporter permease [Elusimicrobia bacterium]|nr:sugar ABC transporter permease [Elusimicrobiota bacterium]
MPASVGRRWLYCLPVGLLSAVFIFLPAVTCIVLAAQDPGLFLRMVKDGEFWATLGNTVGFAFFSVSSELVLGLALALLLNARFAGRGFVRAAVLIPWALPAAIMAMGWSWMLHDHYGVIGDALGRLGFLSGHQKAWLAETGWARFWIVATDVWKTTPFVALIALTGLCSIPNDILEAAKMDGAGAWARFRLVILPLIKPYLLTALLFRAIQAFGIFDHIWVMTGGGPAGATKTLALYIYEVVFRYLDLRYGAALTLALAAIVILFAGAGRLVMRHGEV